MGLDNGIIIKARTIRGEGFLLKNFEELQSGFYENNFDFGYWRKCWNIRQKFIDDFDYDKDEQGIKFKITDIPAIIDSLKYFLNRDNWDEYNGYTSLVFNWYEEVASIATAIRNLYFFYIFVLEDQDNGLDINDEDFDIYFYDSY